MQAWQQALFDMFSHHVTAGGVGGAVGALMRAETVGRILLASLMGMAASGYMASGILWSMAYQLSIDASNRPEFDRVMLPLISFTLGITVMRLIRFIEKVIDKRIGANDAKKTD